MFDILEIFDAQFSIYSIVISIISIFLLYYIFRHALKHSSNRRVLFLSIIIYILMAATGITIYYMSENEYMFSSVEKYHVNGKLTSIHEDSIEVNVTSSNLNSIGKGKSKINITEKTVYSIYSNSEDTKVNREEVNVNSNVEVICKVSEDGKVTALKVTKIIY